jgi:hypothetical protein
MLVELLRTSRFRVDLVLAWYDGWVGYHLDRDNNALYLFAAPWIGLKIKCPGWHLEPQQGSPPPRRPVGQNR